MTDFARRFNDNPTGSNPAFDIDKMIAAEADEKQRVFLLILNNINRNLVENSRMTCAVNESMERHVKAFKQHVDNFEIHTAEQEAILNRGRGAWKVLAWFAGVVWVVLVAVVGSALADMKSIHVDIAEGKAEHIRGQIVDQNQDKRLVLLETAKSDIK